MRKDTIYALATVLGKSGVAIIRISGSNAFQVLQALKVAKPLEHGEFAFSKIFHPDTGKHLDDALILKFIAPHSFTGENTIELHLHGSIAVIKDTLMALQSLPFLRPALPGEFSKIAFFNNKLDLTRAEALVNLINAETSVQKDVALRQLGGELEGLYEGWRKQIVTILALIEALIDFPDEDIPEATIMQIMEEVESLRKKISKHLSDASRGEVITRGVKIAIIGKPNAGKSSLLNAIARREVAIVSEVPGTTRDIIEVRMDLRGFPVILYDTAGIRETKDIIEIEGVKRALKAYADSDITLHIMDPFDADSMQSNGGLNLMVYTKSDLLSDSILLPEKAIKVSSRTGEGLDSLCEALISIIEESYTPSHEPLLTSSRYKTHLKNVINYLSDFSFNLPLEMAAEYIRVSARELGEITGRVEVEEVLDEIFSSFCIGK